VPQRPAVPVLAEIGDLHHLAEHFARQRLPGLLAERLCPLGGTTTFPSSNNSILTMSSSASASPTRTATSTLLTASSTTKVTIQDREIGKFRSSVQRTVDAKRNLDSTEADSYEPHESGQNLKCQPAHAVVIQLFKKGGISASPKNFVLPIL
jgi:hypothetical protein